MRLSRLFYKYTHTCFSWMNKYIIPGKLRPLIIFFSSLKTYLPSFSSYLQKSLLLFLKFLLVIPNAMFSLTLKRGYNKTKVKTRMKKTLHHLVQLKRAIIWSIKMHSLPFLLFSPHSTWKHQVILRKQSLGFTTVLEILF